MSNKMDLNAILAVQLGRKNSVGSAGKSAYEIWLEQGNEGSEAEFLASLRSADALPYGGSKEWLEANGDPTQLYRIDGYVWGYTEASGWTGSDARFRVVGSEDSMTGEGGTPYLLRQGDTGTVYAFTPASGDAGIPQYDSLPEMSDNGEVSSGDVVACGGRKWSASLSEVVVQHNAYQPDTEIYDGFNKRINSVGSIVSHGGAYLTDYVAISYDESCICTISGIAELVQNYSSHIMIDFYDENKVKLHQISAGVCLMANSGASFASQFTGKLPVAFRPFAFDGNTKVTATQYIRIKLGIAADGTTVDGAACEGLVINLSTLNTTETRITWTDVGGYVPPIEAHWAATEETYAVIDGLSAEADSGDRAVYSADGYLYTYISGGGWMAQSRYVPPELSIDGELSDTSTFAVQNRVVTSAILAEQAKTRQNTAEITDLKGQVAGLAAGSGSVTLPDAWREAANVCVATIKSLQVGKHCVTFPFFSDNHQRLGDVGRLIAYVMKECGIPYAFFGGDCITSGAPVTTAPDDTFKAEAAKFDEVMAYIPAGRLCRVVGNHEHYLKYRTEASGSFLTHTYTRDQVYDEFLRGDGITQTKHYGEDGTYYYVDDLPSKVRFVVLNTNRKDMAGAGTEIIDATQLDWLQSTALSLSESGWGVVVFSHCPIANPYHANVSNAAEVIAAVNACTDATGANNKPVMIGWFSGHIHRDRVITSLLINGDDNPPYIGDPSIPLGFTQVTISSDNTAIAYENDDGTPSDTKHAVDGSDQSHAIDFVTINRVTGEVNLTRLGIGEDRSYFYK